MRFPFCPYHVPDVLTPGMGVGRKRRLSLGWRRDRYPLRYIITQKNSGRKLPSATVGRNFYDEKEPVSETDRRRAEKPKPEKTEWRECNMKIKINTKRLFSSLLALMMVVNMVPPPLAFAAETDGTGSNMETLQPEEPDTQSTEPDTPPEESDAPTELDTLPAESDTPTEPDTPPAESDTPTEPDTPTAEPDTQPTEPNDKTSPVQALIDALPDADTITADNAEDVAAQLTAIDEARAELTDEELDALDTTRYEAAVSALMTLAGTPGAEQPQTLEGETPPTTGVATVNGTSYTTIDEAFTAVATMSGTVTIDLLGDATASKSLTVPSGADITLNIPKGKTLTSNATGLYAIEVTDGGKLTVTGGGTITTASADYCVKVQANATFTVPETTTVTFKNTNAEGVGLDVGKDATVTLSGGTFTGTKHAIRVANSTVLGFIMAPGYNLKRLEGNTSKWCELNLTSVDGTAQVVKAPATATLADQILEKYCQTVKLEVTVTSGVAVNSYTWFKKGQLGPLAATDESSYDLSVAEHNNSSIYCIIDGSDDAGNWQVFSNVVKIAVPDCTHADINSDGYCNTCETQMIASVTCEGKTTYYADFLEAFNAAKDKTATIKMFAGFELTGTALSVTADTNITLEIDPIERIFADTGPIFTIDGGTLTLKSGKLWCTKDTCVEVNSGHLNVYGGTIIGGPTAISTAAGCTTLYGGTFNNDEDTSGDTITVTDGGTVADLLPTGLGYTLGYQNANGTAMAATGSTLTGKVTIAATESVVESVAISNENNVLTAKVMFKDGVPENIPLIYEWYADMGSGFDFVLDGPEPTLSLDGLSAGTYRFRCDVIALGQTTPSNVETVTVEAPAAEFAAQRVDPTNGNPASDTYEFGDTICIMATIQAAEYSSESIPASIEVCEGGNSLISVQSMFMQQGEGTYISLLMLPAAMFETEKEHTLTLKFTDLYGQLAAAEAELKPFTVNPSECGDDPHVVVDETKGTCQTCGVHCDAKVGDNAYLKLDQAIEAAVGDSAQKDVTITLLPPLNPAPLNPNYRPVVTASPFTVPTDKKLTIEAPTDIQGIITQITVEDGASLSLPALKVASSMEIMDGGDTSMCQESPALRVNGKLTMNDGGICGLVVGENATKLDISGSQVLYMSAEKRTLADIQTMMPGYAFYSIFDNPADCHWLTQGELDASVFQGDIMVYSAPAILASPASAEVPFGYTEGQISTLDATAEENPDEYANLHDTIVPTYQWYEDGEAITNATNPTYTVPTGLAVGDHAYYCYVTCTDDEDEVCILRSKTATVTVNPAPLTITGATLKERPYSKDDTSAKVESVTFTDGAGNPVTLTMGKDKDYTAAATYTDSADAGENKPATVTVKLADTVTDYTLKETTYHNATGTVTAVSITGAAVTFNGSFHYTGTAQEPNPTVTLNGQTLVKGTDYTVAYTGNTNVGQATVEVTGTGNYKDTVSGNFTIAQVPLTIKSAALKPKTYNGDTTAEVDSVTFSGASGDVPLTMGDDNDYTATAEFTDASAGTGNKTATVTVTLKNGNYSLAKNTFDLTGQTISKADADIARTVEPEWTQAGATFTLTGSVTFTESNPENRTVEFSRDGTTWQDTLEFTGVQPTTAFTFKNRLKETQNYNAGPVVDQTFTSPKLGGNVTVTMADWTYSETASEPQIACEPQSDAMPTVEYKAKGADDSTYSTIKPTNAGNYVVRVSFAETTQFKPSTGTAEFTIKPAALPEITLSAESFTYNGSAQKPSITNSDLTEGKDYDVSYSRGDAATTDLTNVGEVKITATGKGNYKETSEKTYTIQKATPVVEWSSPTQELTYTGEAAAITAPTVTLAGSDAFNGTIAYSYEKDGTTHDGLPVDAGTYTVKASVVESGNYTAAESKDPLTLTINKSTPEIKFKDTYKPDKEYDGTAIADPDNNALDIKGASFEEVQFTWSGNHLDAGKYTLTATIPATGNTEKAEATKEVTISAKSVPTPTVEFSETSFVYDGTEKEPKVTVKDGNTQIPEGEYTVAYGNNTNAGDATVSITDKENGNYVVGNASKGFEITQASVSDAKVTTSESFTYDGTAHVPSSVTVVLDKKTLAHGTDYTYAAAENINAGTATVTVTGTGNYTGTVNGSFNIAKAPLTITAKDQTISYGGSISTGTEQVTANSLISGDTLESITLTPSSANVPGGDIIPSAAKIQKDGTDVSGNYEVTYTKGNLTINKSTPEIKFKDTYKPDKEYDGTTIADPDNNALDIKGTSFEDVQFTWSGDHLNAGTYTLTATIPETGNTEKAVATKEITINPKKVTATVTVSPESYKYTGSAITPTNVTVKDGATTIPEREYSISYKNNTDVGEATVTVKDNAGGNYTFSDANAKFQITSEPISVTLSVYSLTLTVGGNQTLTATVIPEKATGKTVNWKSSNPEVASVDENTGVVTAVKPGTAIITAATKNEKSASCTVTVNPRRYNISYNSNGGSETMKSIIVTDGEAFVLPGCGFTPPEKKIFDCWAVGSASGEKIKAGESHKFEADTTLYAIWKDAPPVVCTVIYNKNDGSGEMPNGTATENEAFALPICGFTAPEGKIFDCWAIGSEGGHRIKPGESYTFTGNTATVYAVWKDKPYDITVTVVQKVKQGDKEVEVPVPGAAVKLMQGTKLITQESTDGNGKFTFKDVKAGIYNLVAEKDGVTMTAMETIDKNKAFTIELPALETKANSVVEIVDSKSEGGDEKILTPDVVVGGLNQEAIEIAKKVIEENKKTEGSGEDGDKKEIKVEKVTVTMSVEEKPEKNAEGVDEIKEKVAEQQPTTAKDTKLAYLDVKVNAVITKTTTDAETEDKTVTEEKPVSETDTIMELVVPFNFEGKRDVKVYRYHKEEDQEAETKALDVANGDRKDGTYMADEESGLIHIYTQKFSTYAIGYTDSNPDNTNDPDNTYQPSGSSGSGGGGGISSYSIGTTTKPENGAVAFDKNNASKGSTVTITVTPEEGYVLDTLTVTDAKNNKLNLTDNGGGKYTFIMPDSKVNVDAQFIKADDKPDIPATEDPTKGFSDLTDNAWYHEAVEYVLSEGIMGGYGNGKFGPDENLSRAQLAQILYNREGRPESAGTSVFTDVVSGKWYTNAIIWANQKGVVGGYGNGLFGPDDPITREQLAVMLWRYAGNPPAANKELHFDDAGEAGSFALEALQWSVENGIITGYGDRRINPKGLATRAQAAQMLMRYLKGMEEK